MRAHRSIAPISLALGLLLLGAGCERRAAPATKTESTEELPPGSTTLDVPDPLGGLVQHAATGGGDALGADAERIYRLLRRNLALVNACYLRARRRAPRLAGRMTVTMVVGPGPKGMVRKASVVERSFSAPRMETCVTGSLRAFSFPRAGKGDLSLRVPLIFH